MTVTLAGLQLAASLFNAAGTCKTLEDVNTLCNSATAAIMVGSITKEARPGNPGTTYWAGPQYALNAKGLPNPGAEYYWTYLQPMVLQAHHYSKQLFVSVAGETPEEYVFLAKLAFDKGADLVELNLSCPAVPLPLAVSENAVLQAVTQAVGHDARVAVKFGPYLDVGTIRYFTAVLKQYPVVKIVSAINTLPLAAALDETGKSRLETPYGALSGPALKPIGLGQVQQWRRLLGPDFAIIGSGGITCGQDVRDYLTVGATATALATAFIEHGPDLFGKIVKELSA